MDLKLRDHVVVVTGGASGIGRATAHLFGAEGASVAVWDLGDNATRAADEIAATYRVKTIGINCDVSDESVVRAAAEQTASALGPIDHLIHAAAIGSGKFGFPFTNLQPADWPRVLKINVMGMVNVAHAIGPMMAERGSGSMVFVASIAGQIGSQTDPPYSASKAANINFAQCMVQTPLNKGVWQAWQDQTAEAERLSYEEWSARKIKSAVPLGKWQTPEAIADMIVFLSSDRAEHVTGQTINVDGGFVMHW